MEFVWSQQSLLTTKLTMPRSYLKMVVPRSHLYDRLAQGSHYPLTLLSAPAGFGKTTLVVEWLRQQPCPVAWVSLDQNDNDLERFWNYLTAALETLNFSEKRFASSSLTGECNVVLEDRLTALINGLMGLPDDILLVLDDYQTITAPSIHHSLEFFLEHMPSQAHLVILTRVDPPLALARWRVRGQLIELRAADLRFSETETDRFLQANLGLQLGNAEIATLHRVTEGWAAGLQLAGLSLLGHAEFAPVTCFAQHFSGLNRHVLHYLTEEVLAHLSVEIQDFLLTTSIVTSMNASLCDAVTGQSHGEKMLEQLEQANLFLTALDEQSSWYRYDHLFAELLRHRLQQGQPQRVAELHQRASCWYEQHLMLPEAIEHAFAAADFDRAAGLLEANALSLLEQGQSARVYAWLKILQDTAFIAKRALLLLLCAGRCLYASQKERYEHFLRLAEQECAADDLLMQSRIATLRAYRALLAGDGVQAIQFAQQALALMHDPGVYPEHALAIVGAGYLCCGELEQAQRALLHGQSMLRQTALPIALASVTVYLGDLYVQQGRLHEALTCYHRSIQEAGEKVFWYSIAAHYRLAALYYQWNDQSRAQDHLQQAMHLSQLYAPDNNLTQGYILSARLAALCGEYPRALDYLEQAEVEAQRMDRQRIDLAHIAALRVQYLLVTGSVEAAVQVLQPAIMPDQASMFLFEREAWSQAYARLFIAQDKAKEAVVVLEDQLQAARAQGRVDSEIALLALQLHAYYAMGDIRHTKQVLEYALLLGQTGNYLRSFIDEGEMLGPVVAELYCRQARRCSGEWQPQTLEYVRQLLTAFGLDSEPHAGYDQQKRMRVALDQLSEREQDVLKLIAAGNSNQEIARTLVVAESTIKTHLNNIYTKLHVNSRLQALTKAHAFGLLDQ